jgi:hypothetical protein
VPAADPYEELIEELVSAIELRECGDPDGRDWTVDSRIRRLEQALLEQHRWRPSRTAMTTGEATPHGILVSTAS